MSAWSVVAALSFGIWLYLLLGRGGFWRERVLPPATEPQRWPSITALVPARNEVAYVGHALTSLLTQDYPGELSVILIDDHSSDATAAAACAAVAAASAEARFTLVSARPLPAGWTGKLWALSEGLAAVQRRTPSPDLILLTDADIVHHPTNLRELAARIETERFDLASLMVRLRCASFAERFLIPAFVFFFEMLYPFGSIRDPRNKTAGAAGGCVLLRQWA